MQKIALTIECDIRDLTRLADACKKVIEQCESVREGERKYQEVKNAGVKPAPMEYPVRIVRYHDKPYKDFLHEPDKVDEERLCELVDKNVLPEITCSHCDWTGFYFQLCLNTEDKDTCPKCHRVLTQNDYGINIFKFMELDDSEKVKYTLYDAGYAYNISIFDRRGTNMSCEMCGVGVNPYRDKLIGVSDTRGKGFPESYKPKFCYNHFIVINKNSRFVKIKGVE